MTERLIPAGEYADLARMGDRIVVCAETAARDAIAVYSDPDGQQQIALLPGAVAGDRVYALYPRIAVSPAGQIAVTYQRGPCVCLSLLGVTEIVRPADEIPHGVEMTCVAWVSDRWRWAYVARVNGFLVLITREIDSAGQQLTVESEFTDTSQGISRIEPDGRIVLNDNDNLWADYPNLSRPWRAGDLVVGQANNAPARALGYLSGDATTPYRIFDGLAFRPRAVQTPTGWTCIATGDPREGRPGIRVVDVPPFVRDVPMLSPMPEGTVIADTLPYVLGTPDVWPRRGLPGTPDNMDLVWDAQQRGVCWVKYGSRTFIEWHRIEDDGIHHHEDRSDGTNTIYYFLDDRWIPRRWAIGDVLDCRANNIRFVTFDGGKTYVSEPWAFTNTLIAGFYDYPCGGDMGLNDVLVVECDNTWLRPGRPGLLERFWFSSRFGAWRFQDWPVGGPKPTFDPPGSPQAVPGLRDGQWSRLGGVRVVPVPPVRPWEARPRVTITDWQPREGPAPLDVIVTVQVSGGPCETLLLTVQDDEEDDWFKVNPQRIETFRLRFQRPGSYEIGAEVTGPGGSDQTGPPPRLVTVTEGEEEVPQPYPSEQPGEWWQQRRAETEALYAEAGKPLDANYPLIPFARVAYDIGALGLTKEASWKKHLVELRAALGLGGGGNPDPQ